MCCPGFLLSPSDPNNGRNSRAQDREAETTIEDAKEQRHKGIEARPACQEKISERSLYLLQQAPRVEQ